MLARRWSPDPDQGHGQAQAQFPQSGQGPGHGFSTVLLGASAHLPREWGCCLLCHCFVCPGLCQPNPSGGCTQGLHSLFLIILSLTQICARAKVSNWTGFGKISVLLSVGLRLQAGYKSPGQLLFSCSNDFP